MSDSQCSCEFWPLDVSQDALRLLTLSVSPLFTLVELITLVISFDCAHLCPVRLKGPESRGVISHDKLFENRPSPVP